jgi:hypothetical protein
LRTPSVRPGLFKAALIAFSVSAPISRSFFPVRCLQEALRDALANLPEWCFM